jgi:hypothetical protein
MKHQDRHADVVWRSSLAIEHLRQDGREEYGDHQGRDLVTVPISCEGDPRGKSEVPFEISVWTSRRKQKPPGVLRHLTISWSGAVRQGGGSITDV